MGSFLTQFRLGELGLWWGGENWAHCSSFLAGPPNLTFLVRFLLFLTWWLPGLMETLFSTPFLFCHSWELGVVQVLLLACLLFSGGVFLPLAPVHMLFFCFCFQYTKFGGPISMAAVGILHFLLFVPKALSFDLAVSNPPSPCYSPSGMGWVGSLPYPLPHLHLCLLFSCGSCPFPLSVLFTGERGMVL